MKKTSGAGEAEAGKYDKRLYADLAARVMAKLEDEILRDGLDLKDYIVADGGIRRKLTSYIIKRLQIRLKDEDAVRGLQSLQLPELLKRAEKVDETIAVKDAKIRYIAAFDYFGRTFSCYDKQDAFLKNKLFDVSFDVNQKITVTCAKCGMVLIRDGIVSVSGLGVDITKTACGLSSLKTADNPFLRHVRPMYCKETGCRRLVCPGDVRVCGKVHVKGKKECTREFCVTCPHEEIVTMVELDDGRRELYHTTADLLAYCRDTMTLLPKEKTRKCATCGRTYSKAANGFDGDDCAFCAPVVKGSSDQKYRRLYKKNSAMLPYLVRKKKGGVCNEDAELILFKVNGQLYRLDKKADGGMKYLKVKALSR